MTGHLIHIGFSKTGSNFLRRWFEEHPQIAFLDGGIAGFRDVHDFARQGVAPEPGKLWRVTSSEALATPHGSVGYSIVDYDAVPRSQMPEAQAQVCSTLAALFPNAYVLLVTRGFRAIMLSGFSQYARTGGDRDLAHMASEREGMLNAWNYDYLARIYGSAFGDRLIILPYELLRDDAERFVREIEHRLGLSHCPPPEVRPNVALSSAELRWYPRLARLVRRLPVGERVRRPLYRAYVFLAFRGRLRPLARLLDRLNPAPPLTPGSIPGEVIETLRGRADCLRGNPLYAPYADDYLF